MNKKGVLSRVLERIPLPDAIDIIYDRIPGWTPAKKPRRKADVKDQFLSLDTIIPDEEIEDFVQMAVMKRSVGLPVYTYKISNLDFLNDVTDEKLSEIYNFVDQPFNPNFYTVSCNLDVNDETKLTLNIRIKEYTSSWKTLVNNAESLSAVFTSNVKLDKAKKVVSVYSGNHQVQDVIVRYLSTVLKWPLNSYRVKEFTNQTFQLGNASFKTAVLLDLIYNRLQNKGVSSTFKELKFFIGGKRKKDGVRDVAIGGKDLLYSQLACEYITLGSDIISFKVDVEFAGQEFSTIFQLKGPNNDILKLVIVDTDDDTLKKSVMDIIQAEYIDMCNTGIMNMPETMKLLESIFNKFQQKDKLLTEVIEEESINSIGIIVSLLDKLSDQDEEVILLVKKFANCHRTILDTIGYDEKNDELQKLFDFVGIESESIDEDSFNPNDLQNSDQEIE
ncbi:hypothetical protein [Paenibacillus ginsengarvi]|uniref:Uncharacterized protein n=1 Tax=Paenibacillus ginsengarvi TaxID=400777 RepID=A0A3B0BSJ9_9BACL|nr:hypothetical protein [Paenibacillus ginsengarvi]RKN74987.1 hypothetical protein D7M11_25960 [Paenibacillus ginsengarvi]